MTSKKLGVVVIGAGMAGKIRIRDLLNTEYDNISWNLLGFLSRRQLEIEGTTQLSEEEVFKRSDVDAVIVCTEPGSHEQTVRKALSAGKHVLVEFPVTSSPSATLELFNIAEKNGLVLHEENIALLSPPFIALQEKLKTNTSPIVHGETKLSCNYNGWAEDFERSGGPFCVNVSLIQSMYELMGSDVIATGGHLEVTEEGFTAVANLSCSKCRDLRLVVKRSKERVKREKISTFTLDDGSVLTDSHEKPTPPAQSTPQTTQKPGLFMQDFIQFVEKVLGLRDGKEDVARSLHCIQLADNIHRCMGI